MICPFCGLRFSQLEAGASCGACPLRRMACGKACAACPRCGYQIPIPPKWLRARRKEPVRGSD